MSFRFVLHTIMGSALCILISCGDSSDVTSEEEIAQESTDLYGDTTFTFPKLSPAATGKLSQWPFFDDFETEVRSLNGVTIEKLRRTTERLGDITDSLQVKIPDSLNTRPIFSRLMIVNTRIKLLDQLAQRRNWDSIQLQMYLNETNKSVAHFYKQINEKYLKDGIDSQRKEDEQQELEKQKRFRDSVFQLEIQDKNKKTL